MTSCEELRDMIPPDILITFSVTRMLQFASLSPNQLLLSVVVGFFLEIYHTCDLFYLRISKFKPPPLRPCILFEIDGSKTYRGGGCELQKTKQNKTKKIYIYILFGKSLQNKSTLNHARATQRGEREKRKGRI